MFYLVIATICFSLSFGLIKDQLSVLPSEFVVLCRLFIAGLIFLPFFKKFDAKVHLKAFFVGMIQFGIMYLCFIKAFKFLQGNEIAILTTTTPVFVAIWSSLFGEKFKPVYIFCIVLSVIGAGIIVWQNLSFNMIIKGVLLMECCNCSFALGQVLWKKFITKSAENVMSSAYFGAVLFVLPFIILNNSLIDITLNKFQVLSILYLSIMPTGIGFWLWNKGAQKVNSSVLAIMNNLKIPLGVVFAILIFHEKINFVNFIVGGTIILLAISFMNYFTKDKKSI